MKNNELHHFGKKGMKWGVRNTLQRIGEHNKQKKEVKATYDQIMSNTKNAQKQKTKSAALITALVGGIFIPAMPYAYHKLNANVRQTKKEAKKLAKELVKRKSKEKYETYLNKDRDIKIRKKK